MNPGLLLWKSKTKIISSKIWYFDNLCLKGYWVGRTWTDVFRMDSLLQKSNSFRKDPHILTYGEIFSICNQKWGWNQIALVCWLSRVNKIDSKYPLTQKIEGCPYMISVRRTNLDKALSLKPVQIKVLQENTIFKTIKI